MINFGVIFNLIGMLLCGIACIEVIPAILEFSVFNTQGWIPFVSSLVFTAFFGFFMIFINRSKGKIRIRVREAFLLTSLAWLICAFFASLPFYWSSMDLSLTDSCFEAVASLTTTGASVIPVSTVLPKGIILWRCLLQWVGGIGIIVMAMTVFPILRIGGMQLFRNEFSDHSDKILPRVSQVAKMILLTYFLFTFVCALLLMITGMNWFDAICHAISALSTSGFSTSNESIGGYNSYWVELIIFIFMLIGGTTLIFFVKLSKYGLKALKDDRQVSTYLIFVLIVGLILSFHLWFDEDTKLSLVQAIRAGMFTTVSVITSTGFILSDFTYWSPFTLTFLFMLSFIGGCTGSTAGGIKILRFYILFKLAIGHLKQLRHPQGVFIPTYQGHRLNETVATSIYTFLVLYCIVLISAACFYALMGLDFTASLSTAAGLLGNIGQGFSNASGPFASFSFMSPLMKWVSMLIMVLGRLELLTFIILLMPSFWKE